MRRHFVVPTSHTSKQFIVINYFSLIALSDNKPLLIQNQCTPKEAEAVFLSELSILLLLLLDYYTLIILFQSKCYPLEIL